MWVSHGPWPRPSFSGFLQRVVMALDTVGYIKRASVDQTGYKIKLCSSCNDLEFSDVFGLYAIYLTRLRVPKITVLLLGEKECDLKRSEQVVHNLVQNTFENWNSRKHLLNYQEIPLQFSGTSGSSAFRRYLSPLKPAPETSSKRPWNHRVPLEVLQYALQPTETHCNNLKPLLTLLGSPGIVWNPQETPAKHLIGLNWSFSKTLLKLP